ncbi:MAG: class I SAM-dependent methyltransferase [Desulfobacterales bacterium]|nr:class I SAM-dependent methyltransferase [Desulfobacterales bacterium]
MSSRTLCLSEDLYGYMKSVSVREPDLLRRLREETAKDPMHMMQISPEQGQFMALLIKVMGVRRSLEVGVYTGYSSICVGMALPEDGNLVACDISLEWTSVARRYWKEAGLLQKIDLRLAPALHTLEELVTQGESGTFDFAFIDADKENYDGYYEGCLKLLRTGGVIAIDNVFWGGRVAERNIRDEATKAIRAINERIYMDERVDVSMIPIGDGLTLVRKR